MSEGFQLAGQGPQAYERYLVPTFFAACADQLLHVAPAGPGQRVLDVACGTGIVARRAVVQIGEEGTVVGVDVNASMIEVAREMSEDATGSITWHIADATALPSPDAAFDVAYCQQGLQFFTDQAGVLREVRRVLAPGGRVAIAMWRGLEHSPAFAALVNMLNRHAGEEAAAILRALFAGPDRGQLRSLMASAGFEKITIRIGFVVVRFPSAEELLRQEVVSSPLAGPVGALGEDRYQTLSRDLTRSCRHTSMTMASRSHSRPGWRPGIDEARGPSRHVNRRGAGPGMAVGWAAWAWT